MFATKWKHEEKSCCDTLATVHDSYNSIKVLFVETPRKFITAKLSIRKPKSHIISTDEDPGLWIESFAVINLRGVSTNKTILYSIAMQTYKELSYNSVVEIDSSSISMTG
jgi:hypothetical protein